VYCYAKYELTVRANKTHATVALSSAKARADVCDEMLRAGIRISKPPMTAPATNGMAASHAIFATSNVLPIEANATKQITINDVTTMDCIVKLVCLAKLGTMMNPPPTPNNPDNSPAVKPVLPNALAHGHVQCKRPVLSSSKQTQGAACLVPGAGCIQKATAFRSISVANSIANILLGTLCAIHTPMGLAIHPNTAIMHAALYRTKPASNPATAATPAETATAINATGVASCTLIDVLSNSKGKAKIPPPAPVSTCTAPTILPIASSRSSVALEVMVFRSLYLKDIY
jgi:hypothetical protein